MACDNPTGSPRPLPTTTYAITFISHGGSTVESVTASVRTAVTRPANPTRDGYDFAGWHSAENGGTEYAVWPYILGGNITMHAQWEVQPLSGQYTVTFHHSGGSPAPKRQVVTAGGRANDPPAMTKAPEGLFTGAVDPDSVNFTFGGWDLQGRRNGGGSFTMNGGMISGNSATSGGGVYGWGSFTMSDGIISDNSADEGGGVYVDEIHADSDTNGDSGFTMSGGAISGNTASSGGGVYVAGNGGTFTISGGEIKGNTANRSGGGVFFSGSGTFTMSGNTVISGNPASGAGNNSGGGGVYVSGFSSASFSKTGGVIYGSDAEATLKNTTGSGDTWGHAVNRNSAYYRDITLNAGDNISTDDTLPTNSGDSLNNWTKR